MHLRSTASSTRLVPERQIHRIDHFLGLPTVLGILGLRFANRLFEPIWNAQNIERVEITFDEQLGLEGRAGYYDTAGALIDMLQSHLMQVLSVVAMEPPISMDETEFRAATSQAIRAVSLWGGNPVLSGTDRLEPSCPIYSRHDRGEDVPGLRVGGGRRSDSQDRDPRRDRARGARRPGGRGFPSSSARARPSAIRAARSS